MKFITIEERHASQNEEGESLQLRRMIQLFPSDCLHDTFTLRRRGFILSKATFKSEPHCFSGV